MGMLVMRMLWFTPTLSGPKSSDVIETAAANMNPELSPINAVPARTANALPPNALRSNKASGVGRTPMASHPVLANRILLQFEV